MSYAKDYLSYLFGKNRFKKINLPKEIPWGSLSLEETLMFHTFQNSLNEYVHSQLNFEAITAQDALQLFKFFDFITNDEFKEKVINKYPQEYALFEKLILQETTLLDETIILQLLNENWQYFTMFALLPSDRQKKGVIIFKKPNGEFFKMKVLGMSSRGLDYYYSNGQTPQGIYRIDGVMPKADKWFEFGKYRRIILNFESEENLKKIIPSNALINDWWKEAILAQKLGRSHLRIHGAGRLNKNIFSSYFPIVATSGCLAVAEGFGFFDQRKLLDEMMKANNLLPEFSNEEKLRGNLIVIETKKIRSILNSL